MVNTDISGIPYDKRYKTDENNFRWILLEEAKTSIGSATRELRVEIEQLKGETVACADRLPDLGDYSLMVWFPDSKSWESVHVEDYFKPITDGFDWVSGEQFYTYWYITQGVTHWRLHPAEVTS
jgi:hypothetical protein